MYIKIYHRRTGISNKNNKYKNSIFIIKYIGKKTNHKRVEINSTGLAQNNIESQRDRITPLDFFTSFRRGLGTLSQCRRPVTEGESSQDNFTTPGNSKLRFSGPRDLSYKPFFVRTAVSLCNKPILQFQERIVTTRRARTNQEANL